MLEGSDFDNTKGRLIAPAPLFSKLKHRQSTLPWAMVVARGFNPGIVARPESRKNGLRGKMWEIAILVVKCGGTQ